MNYVASAATAARMMMKFGQAITLRQAVQGAYDPATGSVTQTVTDVSRNGAVFDYGAKLVDGTLIQQGDKQLYMEPGVIPSVQHRVVIGGVEYGIVTIKEINPAGVPILYELQLRKG